MANVCPMCSDFSAPTTRLLIGHIGRVHSSSPNFLFTCGLDNCQRTLRSYSALKKHYQRKHRGSVGLGSTESSSAPALLAMVSKVKGAMMAVWMKICPPLNSTWMQ